MSKPLMIVECASDAALMRRLLPHDLLLVVELIVAQRSGRIPSLARSYLVQRRTPVAILMDADSLEPSVIEERRSATEEVIRLAAGSLPIKVVAAIPSVEAWYFAVPQVIERVMGVPLPPDWVFFGSRDPWGVFDQLEKRSTTRWSSTWAVAALDASDIQTLQDLPPVRELTEFLQDVASRAAVNA
jgi:hypothetical protein